MVIKELREVIASEYPEAILFDNPSFDNSIVGLTTDGCVVYALESMIAELAKDDNISEDEALEFIDYNTMRVIPYIQSECKPIVIDNSIIMNYKEV